MKLPTDQPQKKYFWTCGVPFARLPSLCASVAPRRTTGPHKTRAVGLQKPVSKTAAFATQLYKQTPFFSNHHTYMVASLNVPMYASGREFEDALSTCRIPSHTQSITGCLRRPALLLPTRPPAALYPTFLPRNTVQDRACLATRRTNRGPAIALL